MVVSIILNWAIGPMVMFIFAWIFLSDLPGLRAGVITMVLVWSDLACADRGATAVLVAINSVFQLAMFSVLGWFYLQLLPTWLGLDTSTADCSFPAIAKSVLVFLGIPLLPGGAVPGGGRKSQGPRVV